MAGERPAKRTVRQRDDRVELARLGRHELPAKRRGPIVDRLAHRLEDLGIGVLGGIFQELQKRIDERECVLAHEVQLGPEPVELGGLGLVEHQPPQVIVLAVKERQRDDLVHRHDLGVAKGRGKDLADRHRTPLRTAAARPSRRGRRPAARARPLVGGSDRPASNCNCTLPSAPDARIQRAAGHKLTALDQVGRQPDLERPWALARRCSPRRSPRRRVLAKEGRVEPDRRLIRDRGLPLAVPGCRPVKRTALTKRSAQRGELAVQAGRPDCPSPRADRT